MSRSSSLPRLLGSFAALGLLALAATARPAEAQVDPAYRLGRTVTAVFQLDANGQRVQVGEIFVEPDPLGGSVEHWALFRDYDANRPIELAPSAETYPGLDEFLLIARQLDATLATVEPGARRCEATPTCVTLTRGTADVADALIRAAEPTRNFGSSASLTVSDGAAGVRRALVRFDTSRIPRTAIVTSAELSLHGLLYGTTTNVYPVLAPWSEATVTWDSFVRSGEGLHAREAGPYLDRLAASMPLVTSGGVGSTNLLSLVQGWVNGSVTNFGMMLGRRAVEGSVVYASSEYPDRGLRPQLTVCFQSCDDRCAEPCALGQACLDGTCQTPEASTCAGEDPGEACSGNGVYHFGRCFCEPGWTGPRCEVAISCPDDCSGNGVCSHGQCFCAPGYEGPSCADVVACPEDCNANGLCMGGACFCYPGYQGASCGERVRV